METILVKPKNDKELLFVKTILEYGDVYFEYFNTEDNINNMPAIMSVEELKKEVQEATKELKNGKGTSHQAVINDIEAWI